MAKKLNEIYSVFGSFYHVEGKDGTIFKCRSTAFINRNGVNKQEVDAVFVLANPGMCQPLDKNYKIPTVHYESLISTLPLTPAKPDGTQHQIMRLMNLRNWDSALIINLSDLICGNLDDFEKQMILAEAKSFVTHSIFSSQRQQELSNIFNKFYGPIILGWGTNSIVKSRAEQAYEKLKEYSIIGWKHDNHPYYYHPFPHLKVRNILWLQKLSKMLNEYKQQGFKNRIFLNGSELFDIPHIEFNMATDEVYVNGVFVTADYLDEYCDGIGLYKEEDCSIPIVFFVNENDIYIELKENEDGSKWCNIIQDH